MNPLLEAFLGEARELLEVAGARFLDLETSPDDNDLLNELFRAIHTIKGASGLFDIPPFTQVVHAAEDILDRVRSGDFTLTSEHIDLLLDAMDQVGAWLDELETDGRLADGAATIGAELSQRLRALVDDSDLPDTEPSTMVPDNAAAEQTLPDVPWLHAVPECDRIELFSADAGLLAITYEPDEQCFFQGHDPVHTVGGIPGLEWFEVATREPWPETELLDPYRCLLRFHILAAGIPSEIEHHLRYVQDQVKIERLPRISLAFPTGEQGHPEYFRSVADDAYALLEQGDLPGLRDLATDALNRDLPESYQHSALRWLAQVLDAGEADVALALLLVDAVATGGFDIAAHATHKGIRQRTEVVETAEEAKPAATLSDQVGADQRIAKEMLRAQTDVLGLPWESEVWHGRIESVATVMTRLFPVLGESDSASLISDAKEEAVRGRSGAPLRQLIEHLLEKSTDAFSDTARIVADEPLTDAEPEDPRETDNGREGTSAGEQKPKARALKVDQARIDALMDLVGELVVAKNALPFLAKRAEEIFGVRELAREIKSQHAVINRLAEDLQHAVMQVRMVPVGSAFQRFPRLVRDLSRKLGKEVRLVLQGEDTEADKNIVEDLADPLIHLVRNSLDHGIETPEARVAAGKSAQAQIVLSATQQDDRVLIEIRDDGKGIDPEVIKRKAYEKGVIGEDVLDAITDADALQLIFAAGFSTAQQISDVSGRGVGMDVVRSTVHRVGGSVVVDSEVGKGTTVRLSLPLSMAVTQVMMVRVGDEDFGVPFEAVRETVKVYEDHIRMIKQREAVVLRDRLLPLYRLRSVFSMSGGATARRDQNEVAVLVVSVGGNEVGLVVDNFHEATDIILKPLEGIMNGFPVYSGTALLGDGRVLLVLNLKELVRCL